MEREALRRAQEMIYQAWDAEDSIERIEIAEQALELSPLCADAWTLLAEDAADTIEEELSYYRNALAAGERALGENFLLDNKGMFWGLTETRPYMRARAGLAHCLWDTGEFKESLVHYHGLLELNPADNQGIRFVLLTSLVIMGQDTEARRLLDNNVEDEYSAVWAYSRALLAYRTDGDIKSARQARAFAVRCNKFVAGYLAGQRKMPKFPPDYISPGEKNEAASYVYDNRQVWLDTPGAIEWLLKDALP